MALIEIDARDFICGLNLRCVLPLAQIVAGISNATSRCFGSALI